MASIDRDSPIPIYHQLKALIREQIERGVWQPGDCIPTEQELCHSFDISRSPVRQALSDLAHEGMLVRRPGRGTFVADGFSPERPGPSAQVDAPIQVMSSDPYWSRVLDQVAEVWNEGHPDQEVSFRVNVVDHNQFYDLLSAAVGSGAAPDVAMVDCVWVAGLARAGFLYALEDLESHSDLYSPFVEANSYEGRLYGLPLKADVSLLWYRKDWFAQEGLEPPRDWNELVDAAGHFLQPEVQEQYGLMCPLAFPGGMVAGEATVYTLMPFIWSAGGQVFDAGYVVLDTPAVTRALEFVRELLAKHRVCLPDVVSYKSDTTPWLFGSGKVSMAFGGSYEIESILDVSGWSEAEFMQRVDCVAPPPAPGGHAVSTVGGTSYVVLRQCRRPALVMSVLKAAINPEVTGDLYRSLLQNSACPSFESFINPEVEPLLARVARMIASGHARSSIPEYYGVSRQLQVMAEAVLSETTPVDEIVRRTAEFVGVISERPCRTT